MGPVWCYWAYPMERFCGSLLPAVKSRRYPYASINRRVIELAQLNQIKAFYGLQEALDLRNRHDIEKTGTMIDGYRDSVFVHPKKVEMLPLVYKQRIAHHLAHRFQVDKKVAKRFVPQKAECWGKIHWLHGGDMLHAADMVKGRSGRDMTYVKYTLMEDLNFHKRNLRAAGVCHPADYYGQLLRLLVLQLPAHPDLKTTDPTTLALAIVKPMNLNGRNSWDVPIANAGDFGALEAIDIQALDTCVVGRIVDRQKVFFIEQLGSKAALEFLDDPEVSYSPANPRQK